MIYRKRVIQIRVNLRSRIPSPTESRILSTTRKEESVILVVYLKMVNTKEMIKKIFTQLYLLNKSSRKNWNFTSPPPGSILKKIFDLVEIQTAHYGPIGS